MQRGKGLNMKRATIDNLRWLGPVAPVVFAAVGLAAVGQEPANVAGDWMLEVTTDGGGTTTPSVMLEQDGTTLSGHYSSEALSEADVTGSDFTFSLEADLQGQAIDVTYTGTLQEDGTLSGEIDLGGFGGGPFTGKRR